MKSGIQTPLYYHSKQLQTKPHQESPRRWVFIQRVALDYQTKCSTRHNWNTICTQAHQHSSPHISIRNICYEQIHSHNIDSNIRESSHSNLAQEVFTTKIQLDSKNNNPNKLGSLFELHPQALSLQKKFIRRFIHHRLPTGKMQFVYRSRYFHCDTIFNNATHHDHFLTCV